MIVDVHTHLGDVLWPGGGAIIREKGLDKRSILDPVTMLEGTGYRETFFGEFLRALLANWATVAEQKRSASATLENLERSMEKSGVTHCVALPIPPYVTFDDLKEALSDRPEILPFTGLRVDLEEGLTDALARDAENGARGVKLHSIIQKTSMTGNRTYDALETIDGLGLPVLFHCGVWSYYPPEHQKRENPAFGGVQYARHMVADFPGIQFIAGHAGLFDVNRVLEELPPYKNVMVDTSFQPPKTINALIQAFGPDRVMFGSDWPFSNQKPALKTLMAACNKDKGVLSRILHQNAAELFALSVTDG